MTDTLIIFCLILSRIVHFAACLLIFGVWTFDRFIVAPLERRPAQKLQTAGPSLSPSPATPGEGDGGGSSLSPSPCTRGEGRGEGSPLSPSPCTRGEGRGEGSSSSLSKNPHPNPEYKGRGQEGWEIILHQLIWIAMPLALLSGAVWFVLIAIQISDLPFSQAMQMDNLRLVGGTEFGKIWKLRLLFWIATAIAASFTPRRGRLKRGSGSLNSLQKENLTPLFPFAARRGGVLRRWIALLCGGALVASLAWAGHGQTSKFAPWHLAADSLHLLTAGIWPAGLLPFALLLLRFRRESDADSLPSIAEMTRRFSATSLAAVAILAATGLVNTLLMIGPISNLVTTNYGRLLSIKIALFLVMMGIGSINLIALKPLVSSDRHAGRRLQFDVMLELVLATAVIVLVALLGSGAASISPP